MMRWLRVSLIASSLLFGAGVNAGEQKQNAQQEELKRNQSSQSIVSAQTSSAQSPQSSPSVSPGTSPATSNSSSPNSTPPGYRSGSRSGSAGCVAYMADGVPTYRASPVGRAKSTSPTPKCP